jgi:vacuolar-type H+-ATPase subunit F/Vma7
MARENRGKVVFVGDEVTALGFRLAGVETRVPDDSELESVLAKAAEEASLVIVTAELAQRIRKAPKDAVLLVISSARGDVAPPDFALRARRELGISP